MKRNLMFADMGGSVILVCDTLHNENGDYKEIARISKNDGSINWKIKRGLNSKNENLENHLKLDGTIKEVTERMAEKYLLKGA